MILKNLLRRKMRTLLTVFGIAIGVSAIIGLGALAGGMQAGYRSMLSSTSSDLVISQEDAIDVGYSVLDESITAVLSDMPEVSGVTGMVQGYISSPDEPFLIVFGYPEGSSMLEKYRVIEGTGIYEKDARRKRGTPVMLGTVAAEAMDKKTGDTVQLSGMSYRVIGIYETGDGFEDSAVLLQMQDAQQIMGKTRQVSLIYVDLKDPSLEERFRERVLRQGIKAMVSSTASFADEQLMTQSLFGFVWAIGGLAILLGGISMMNSQLMSVYERTREIGVLRALGWKRRQVMTMILGESLSVCFMGGLVGTLLGWMMLVGLSKVTLFMGTTSACLQPDLILQAFLVVFLLGLTGGLYPAWKASQLLPVEALRYEGGTAGRIHRLPVGGMAVQGLWQRSTRTLLTLFVIGITVGVLVALEAMIQGFFEEFTGSLFSSQAEVIIRQADVSDSSLSFINDRIGAKISVMPEVQSTSGWIFTALMLPEANSFFMLQGFAPNEFAINKYRIVEGKSLTGNKQILLGRMMADTMNKKVGETIELSGIRFRVVGIYESDAGWEQLGGIISVRDAQIFIGKPRKVTMYMVKLKDGADADRVVEHINSSFEGISASKTSDFLNNMPDMQSLQVMMAGISFLSILVGGVGVLNTMLMSVMERTREIGVLRSLGWRKRDVLKMILEEAFILGIAGAVLGIILAFGLAYSINSIEMVQSMMPPVWEFKVFLRAIVIALSLGVIGGLYPAYRATRLLPTEALRYE